ncbi:biotin/lipoyl-containing protein [Robbsia sp. KACC 23696]|uniref:acetyl-CoA carboxylase biotin carboxyl carrier protein n=1 Tax=Robbsia sp. KACC 23696 TaxID=3149231 RepID=UPI00325C20B6
MHLEKIEALITLLHASSVSELSLREGDSTLRLTRSMPPTGQARSSAAPLLDDMQCDKQEDVAAEPAPDEAVSSPPSHKSPMQAADIAIPSPMFGVVHLTPSPNDPAFVTLGDTVTVGTTLCTVEAMKTFNAVEAETAGVVTAILVKAGDEVKPGQILFRIAP